MQNTFPVHVLDSVQVVDSRLIAKELGIAHHNFMATLKEYQQIVESFGHQLTFETEVGKRRQGGGNPQKYCYLNEDQCLFLGTLSKNTPKVVEFKRKLVATFSQARRSLQEASQLAQQLPKNNNMLLGYLQLLKNSNEDMHRMLQQMIQP